MTRPRVVIADQIAAEGVDLLSVACEVVDCTSGPKTDLEDALGNANALVVRSATKVDAQLLEYGPQLEVIGRAGVGLDNIDLDAAAAAGIVVVNAPNASTISAAEHTFALLLAIARRIPEADASLRSGAWDRSRLKGVELNGKTLGIIGLGRIGGHVAKLANGFGMTVVAYDPYISAEKAASDGARRVDLTTLFGVSDFISIHMPRTPETERLIDERAIASMKRGVRIVNAARGGIVDETALAAALRSGQVAGLAIDVYAEEPALDNPLLEFRQVVATPHLGASTREAQTRAAIDTAAAVLRALGL